MAFAWKPSIVQALSAAADAAGLDRGLVRAVAYVESRGNPRAQSPVGAQGLMQLMPGTAKALGVSDPFDPQQNANGASRYLAQLLKQFGSIEAALWAYNWGPGNVKTALAERQTIPGQVIGYARKVLDRAAVERANDPLGPAPPAPPVALGSRFCCPGCGLRLVVSAVERDDEHGI